MNHYRFRAECERDFLRLKVQLEAAEYEVHHDETGLPDIEVDIFTLLDIQFIRQLLLSIPDGHVMAETLAIASEYSENRTYTTVARTLFN